MKIYFNQEIKKIGECKDLKDLKEKSQIAFGMEIETFTFYYVD